MTHTHDPAPECNPSGMRKLIAGLAAAVFAAIGLGWAGLMLSAGTAQAVCAPMCHGTQGLGDYLPQGPAPVVWDTNVCHEYHQAQGGNIVEGPLPPDAPSCPPIAFMCH
jgi:hypothetical protein